MINFVINTNLSLNSCMSSLSSWSETGKFDFSTKGLVSLPTLVWEKGSGGSKPSDKPVISTKLKEVKSVVSKNNSYYRTTGVACATSTQAECSKAFWACKV